MMEEQKHKLLDNTYHDHDREYETDESVNGVESSFLSPESIRRLRNKKIVRTASHVAIGLVFATVFYLLGLYLPIVPVPNRPHLFNPYRTAHCGNSSEEAFRNGCVIDLIPGAWVHPSCYDQELEKEFLEAGDWKWYADPEGKNELSQEFMRRTPPSPVYVSLAYHDAHCAFTWRKLHRAATRGTPIDSHIGSYVHTKHCSGALSKSRYAPRYPEYVAPARFYEIFTHCDLLENLKGEKLHAGHGHEEHNGTYGGGY
ncbi:hypothetical protein V8F06_005192 [Rhypophila decipiens]